MNLPVPKSADGRAGLSALLEQPSKSLIALDFDGTLSPIVADPAASRLAPGGHDALRAISPRIGQLAIITGRQARVVVELGGLTGVPGIVVEGQYGAEQWRDGELRLPEPPAGIAAVRAALPELLADADPGVWVEDKESSLVVHTRRAADPAGELDRLSPRLLPLAETNGLEAKTGRNVFEIRPPGIDKGQALRRLVAEFNPAAILFGGDDVGDLPGYDAVAELRAAGIPGLTVCSASAEAPQVAERADLVVDGPPGLVELLAGIADRIG
jgi:trehalose 6-phosphate phosphatase